MCKREGAGMEDMKDPASEFVGILFPFPLDRNGWAFHSGASRISRRETRAASSGLKLPTQNQR